MPTSYSVLVRDFCEVVTVVRLVGLAVMPVYALRPLREVRRSKILISVVIIQHRAQGGQ